MKAVLEFIDRYHMLGPGELVICAVSGGADSMCLLDVLIKASAERDYRVAAAHFNHRLRGEQSDSDESFVTEYCHKNKITLYTGAADVGSYAEEKGMGTEEAARELRYAFFEETARNAGASRVATAHNANDNAETVLMNMARGSGLKGLCGIPPVRGIYIRPLLGCERETILSYLSENKIEHVEDETNSRPIYTRNRIRLNVLPSLISVYPGFLSAVTSNSELLRKDEEYLTGIAGDILSEAEKEAGTIRMDAAKLSGLSFSISSRVIRGAAMLLDKSLDSVHIDSILKLSASRSPSGRLTLPGGLYVYRDYSGIIFSSGEPDNVSFAEICLKPDEWSAIPELGMEFFLENSSKTEKIHTSFNTFFFKKNNICGNIVVRSRKIGDRIELYGKKGTKTLKKLFIDMKIPVYKRNSIPVICDEKEVLAIPGIGISSKHAAENDDEALKVCWRSC